MNTVGVEHISEFIKELLSRMGIEGSVSVVGESGQATPVIHIQALDDGKFLIGKNGQNLKALEQVARAVAWRKNINAATITLDVNDYRKTTLQNLVDSVHETARRVQETKKSEAFNPMSSYERRIVHTELAAYSDLATESVGQEPYRRVVIKPL